MSNASATAGASSWEGSRFRRWMLRPEAPALVFIAALLVIFSITADGFLSGSNFERILDQVAVIGVIALAVNVVVLSGEIDISVGSMLGLCAVVAGLVAAEYGGLALPLLAGMATGAVAGSVNGLLVTLGRVPAIIVSLGMLYALRGLVTLITGGSYVTQIPEASRQLGIGSIFGIEMPIFVLFGLFAVMALIGSYSNWGRNVYAIGGNRRASRLAGLPLNRTRFLAFMTVGIFVGIAATIYMGRVGSIQTSAGSMLELQVIAAVVIGGTSIAGGRGSALAALSGAVLIGVILNGIVLLGVPGVWQNVVLGGLILVAVTVDAIRRRVLEDDR